MAALAGWCFRHRDSVTIVWHTPDGSVNDPAMKAHMQSALEQVAAAPSVASITGPYDPAGARQISQDGKTAYATVTFAGPASSLPKQDVLRVIDLVRGARRPQRRRLDARRGRADTRPRAG